MKRVACAILIVGLLVLAGCTTTTMVQDPAPLPEQTKELCETGGAEWKQFKSSCDDTCLPEGVFVECDPSAYQYHYSCDCGPDQCWNGYQCQPNDAPWARL